MRKTNRSLRASVAKPDARADDQALSLPRRYRLLIADDDSQVLDEVQQLLKSHYDIVGIARNGLEVVDTARRTRPDLAIIDISMPVTNGLEAVKMLRRAGNQMKILMLSIHTEPAYAEAAFEAGAQGYVAKTEAGPELITAIESILAGDSYRSQSVQ